MLLAPGASGPGAEPPLPLSDNPLVIVERSGALPKIAPDAWVAPTATLVGNVSIGACCVIDHGALVVSGGPPIHLEAGVTVMAGAIIRSTGGFHRPAYDVSIGKDCLIGPQAALVGCRLGEAVYVATGVMIFHGAHIGEGCRIGARGVVHAGAVLPPRSRVGMGQFAIAQPDGRPALVTGDLDAAGTALAASDFFGKVFGADPSDPENLEALHRQAARTVASETWALSDRLLE